MKDSKNIYELLNQIDFDIEDYKKEQLTDVEKQSLKKSFRKSISRKRDFKKIAAAAAALIMCTAVLSQTNFGKNAYAVAASKVSQTSYSISKALGIKRSIEPYASVVGETKEDNGIEVKLSEVIIDNDRITFNTVFNTKKPVEDALLKNVKVYINGKEIEHSASGSSSGALDDTNTLFYSLCYYEVEGIEQMDDIKIKLVLEDLKYYVLDPYSDEVMEGVEKGKWEFEFTANGKELAAKTKSLPIDYTFKIDNQIYRLEKLEYNPVRQTIIGNREIIGEYKESYFIQLKGHNNLGNQVSFMIESATPDEVVFSYETTFPFLDEWSDEITSLTLAPFADGQQVGEEFTIPIEEH